MSAKTRPEQRLLWELGARVRARRIELRLSQERLGQRIGKLGNEIGKIERGEKDTGVSTIVRVAEALEVDPGVLVAGLDDSAGERTRRD